MHPPAGKERPEPATAPLYPLARILVERGFLEAGPALAAQASAQAAGRSFDAFLKESGTLPEAHLYAALAELHRVPYVDVSGLDFDAGQLNLLPEYLARRHTCLPLEQRGRQLTVVMADPVDLDAVQDIAFATGRTVTALMGAPGQIQEAIQRHYSRHLEGAGALIEAGSHGTEDPFLVRWGQASALEPTAEDGPVVQLLNLVLRKAIQLGASDIHLEPGQTEGVVRFRLDGLLTDQLKVPSGMHPSLVSRLKILGRMDIAERRLPQDGSARVKVDAREVDLRLSTIPLRQGEKAVIRILDAAAGAFELDSIGFTPGDFAKVEKLIRRHMGMVIMTGPTGSGKTTTLYSMLNRIKSRTLNIVTVEDPIEYNYDGLNQMQVNADIHLTFASGLRSILRQDPDVILVGEIRDAETAEIACRAALTGHLVFSTLHTNDAPSSITRLLDIGLPKYLVASVLSGIIGQRLVRRVCPDCQVPEPVDPAVVAELGLPEASLAGGRFMRGAGCARCHDKGYRGRLGVFETLVPDSRMRDLVLQGASEEDIRAAARDAGMRTLMEDGLEKAKAGITTLAELGRVLEVGEYVTSSCLGCGRVLNSSYRFCPFCRLEHRRVCAGCGAALQPGWVVCADCGTAV